MLNAYEVQEEIQQERRAAESSRLKRELAAITALLRPEVEKAKKNPYVGCVQVKFYNPLPETIKVLRENGWTVFPEEKHSYVNWFITKNLL